ncbi:MAG: galactose-1-phosphate uridylyltransferase [Acidobacteria bacterium]|nr:MAG: galactose-1-phosphate uridylyltransferase [Acidobacteriota bacterium]
MSELRHEPISRRWVIIATERSRRPMDFDLTPTEMPSSGNCPFCYGNESKTPPEILALRDGTPPNTPGWSVRVVPNKYPALMIEGELGRKGVGLYDRMRGIGAHEVIIESPDHHLNLCDMPSAQLEQILLVYQERLRDLMRDPRFKYVLLFKNHGEKAGASLAHPHTQLIATPVTPREVAMELETSKNHHQLKERCLICDLIFQEIESGERIVSIGESYVSYAPFASRFPFEIFFAPRAHCHSYADIPRHEIAGVARGLKDTLQRLKKVLRDPPYNFVLHTSPNVHTFPKRSHYWDTLPFDYHWHIEILPRLTRVAGFEWGTGFYINPTAPEEAALFLREAEPD